MVLFAPQNFNFLRYIINKKLYTLIFSSLLFYFFIHKDIFMKTLPLRILYLDSIYSLFYCLVSKILIHTMLLIMCAKKKIVFRFDVTVLASPFVLDSHHLLLCPLKILLLFFLLKVNDFIKLYDFCYAENS